MAVELYFEHLAIQICKQSFAKKTNFFEREGYPNSYIFNYFDG